MQSDYSNPTTNINQADQIVYTFVHLPSLVP